MISKSPGRGLLLVFAFFLCISPASVFAQTCAAPALTLPVPDLVAIQAYRTCIVGACEDASPALIGFDVCGAASCDTQLSSLVAQGCQACAFGALLQLSTVADICPGGCAVACQGLTTTTAPAGSSNTTSTTTSGGVSTTNSTTTSTSTSSAAGIVFGLAALSDTSCVAPPTNVADALSSLANATHSAAADNNNEGEALSDWGRRGSTGFAVAGGLVLALLAGIRIAGACSWLLKYCEPLYHPQRSWVPTVTAAFVFAACALLAAGQGSTTFDVQYTVGDGEKQSTFDYDFWTGIEEMQRLDADFLAYFMLISTGYWPFVKQLLVLFAVLCAGCCRFFKRNHGFALIQLLSLTGKGAFADIALVCFFVAVMDLDSPLSLQDFLDVPTTSNTSMFGDISAALEALPTIKMGVAPRRGLTFMMVALLLNRLVTSVLVHVVVPRGLGIAGLFSGAATKSSSISGSISNEGATAGYSSEVNSTSVAALEDDAVLAEKQDMKVKESTDAADCKSSGAKEEESHALYNGEKENAAHELPTLLTSSMEDGAALEKREVQFYEDTNKPNKPALLDFVVLKLASVSLCLLCGGLFGGLAVLKRKAAFDLDVSSVNAQLLTLLSAAVGLTVPASGEIRAYELDSDLSFTDLTLGGLRTEYPDAAGARAFLATLVLVLTVGLALVQVLTVFVVAIAEVSVFKAISTSRRQYYRATARHIVLLLTEWATLDVSLMGLLALNSDLQHLLTDTAIEGYCLELPTGSDSIWVKIGVRLDVQLGVGTGFWMAFIGAGLADLACVLYAFGPRGNAGERD